MKTKDTSGKFNIGDKVVHKTDPTYTGTITKMKYVSPKGLSFGDFYWLYLDGSDMPSGRQSTDFLLIENEKQLENFDESLFKSYINKFSDEDQIKCFDILLNRMIELGNYT